MNTGEKYRYWEDVYDDLPCFLFAVTDMGILTKMNREMREKLGVEASAVIGRPVESILTVGSKIFWQTHFYPLIKMQNSAREIYLSFKGPEESIPVLLNVKVVQAGSRTEIFCSGMEISNRNRYEKELLAAKKTAEDALNENIELSRVRNELLDHQRIMEIQYQNLRSLQEQQQEIFKLIAHDLQEPLRKSIFFSDHLLTKSEGLPEEVQSRLKKIIRFNTQLKDMLITLQRFEEVSSTKLKLEQVNLKEIFASAVAEMGPVETPEISIVESIRNDAFIADKTLLTNMFTELLRSSIKTHNPDNPVLNIEISSINTQKNIFAQHTNQYQYDTFVKISYSDNGSGFNTDTSKVFNIIQKSVQFNQISIGLAYCKKIVELHTGYMVAKSVKAKGVGFTIWLPLKPN